MWRANCQVIESDRGYAEKEVLKGLPCPGFGGETLREPISSPERGWLLEEKENQNQTPSQEKMWQ